MIDFRYHVISIVAVFLALATGLVLGASLLNTQLIETQNDQNESLIARQGGAAGRGRRARGRSRSRSSSSSARSAPLAVRDLLVGQRVVLVTLPGAARGRRPGR